MSGHRRQHVRRWNRVQRRHRGDACRHHRWSHRCRWFWTFSAESISWTNEEVCLNAPEPVPTTQALVDLWPSPIAFHKRALAALSGFLV